MHRFAHLRENMHMLMAVDEIRKPAEGGREGLDLRADLDRDRLRFELAADGRAQRVLERKKRAVAQRAVIGGERLERRGQRQMQADRDPLRARGENGQRHRLGARERGRHHHHRRGIDAAAQNEFADRVVDAGRNSVIVGAEPDAARAGACTGVLGVTAGVSGILSGALSGVFVWYLGRCVAANADSTAALTGSGSKTRSIVRALDSSSGFQIPPPAVLASDRARRRVSCRLSARYSAASLRSLSAVFRFCSATK